MGSVHSACNTGAARKPLQAKRTRSDSLYHTGCVLSTYKLVVVQRMVCHLGSYLILVTLRVIVCGFAGGPGLGLRADWLTLTHLARVLPAAAGERFSWP